MTALNIFRVLLAIGIVPNVLLGITATLWPATLDTLQPDLDAGAFWPRTAGILLLIVTAMYVPVTLRPLRHLAIAWLLVAGRGAAGASFLIGLLLEAYPTGVTVLAAHDLGLALLQATVLGLALRGSRPSLDDP